MFWCHCGADVSLLKLTTWQWLTPFGSPHDNYSTKLQVSIRLVCVHWASFLSAWLTQWAVGQLTRLPMAEREIVVTGCLSWRHKQSPLIRRPDSVTDVDGQRCHCQAMIPLFSFSLICLLIVIFCIVGAPLSPFISTLICHHVMLNRQRLIICTKHFHYSSDYEWFWVFCATFFRVISLIWVPLINFPFAKSTQQFSVVDELLFVKIWSKESHLKLLLIRGGPSTNRDLLVISGTIQTRSPMPLSSSFHDAGTSIFTL